MLTANKKYLSLGLTGIILLGVIIAGFLSPLQSYLRSGDRAFTEGNYSLALKEYQIAAKESPDSWNVQVKIAQTYLKQADFTKAQVVLDELVTKDQARSKALNPMLAEVKLALAKQALTKGSSAIDTAIYALREAHKYQPDNKEVNSLLAKELFSLALQDPMNVASPELKEALTLDPKPAYKVDQIRRYALNNDFAMMDATLKSLTTADLADPIARTILAGTYIDAATRQNPPDALVELDQVLKVLPENPALLAAKMQQLYNTKSTSAAQGIAENPKLPATTRGFLQNYWRGLQDNFFAQTVKKYNSWELGAGPPIEIIHDQGATWAVSSLLKDDQTEVTGLNLQDGKTRTLGVVPGTAYICVPDGLDYILYAQAAASTAQGLYYAGANGQKGELYRSQQGSSLSLFSLSPDRCYLAVMDGTNLVLLSLQETQGRLQAQTKATIALAPFPEGQFLGWSPDSNQIMFWQMNTKKILAFNTQGESLNYPTNSKGIVFGGWNPQSKIITSNNSNLEVGLMDQSGGTVKPLLSSSLFQAILAENSYQLAGVMDSVSQSDNQFSFLANQQDWSPAGSYVALNARLRSAGQTLWVLKAGATIPFPVEAPGVLIGWSGPNKLLFADYDKLSQPGDGRLSEIGKVPIVEITLKP